MPAKKNPRKQNLGLWLAVLVVVVVCVLPIPVWSRVLLIVVLAAAFAYWRRSIIFFLLGNRKLVGNEKKGTAPDLEKAWGWYRRAWDAHIRLDYAAIIASTFIQRGDARYGKEILESVIMKSHGTDLEKSSKVALSMAYWRLDDLQGAIDVLEEVRKEGYSDKNLYVNLGTYLLEKGDYKRARKINDEAKKLGPESPGITDNRGWYYIATGDWDNAKKLYEELTEDRKPKFPEAYVHAAQVKVHFGKYEDAVDLLERALGQRFVLTAGVSAETIEGMLDDLRDPSRRKQAAAAIDASARIVAAGGVPLGLSSGTAVASSTGNAAASADVDAAVGVSSASGVSAQGRSVALVQASEAEESDDELSIEHGGVPADEELAFDGDDFCEDEDEPDTTVDDDDEREPNTDLDESDFLDDDDEEDEEDEPDADVGYDLDDDDREPNTDLDDDDDLYDDDDEVDSGAEDEDVPTAPADDLPEPSKGRRKK
ncbi:MAG: tetratricopeptide repeat protein [Sphaerochaetaceae bacterium]|nr:tetratricopeptide repeat protein [Sphaerochaetaceae bacterium]